MNLITLTTDFGTQDGYVGAMKGVILGINPRAVIVDLTHDIAPGDVMGGAFALANAARWFPSHAIHLAVVDPGVGSRRRAIAVETTCGTFVGPDNGLFSFVAVKGATREIRELANRALRLAEVSRTFHGRDIFAPGAAHLSRGTAFKEVGPRLRSMLRLPITPAKKTRDGLQGAVVHIDRFGNAITNIPAGSILEAGCAKGRVIAGDRAVGPLRQCYADAAVGKPLALIGSGGCLEVSVYRGSAAEALGLAVGTKVQVCACD